MGVYASQYRGKHWDRILWRTLTRLESDSLKLNEPIRQAESSKVNAHSIKLPPLCLATESVRLRV